MSSMLLSTVIYSLEVGSVVLVGKFAPNHLHWLPNIELLNTGDILFIAQLVRDFIAIEGVAYLLLGGD